MIICQMFVEFIFYSFLGWVWESIYCTAKEKKWADRGFLFGPVCPIYGACIVIAILVAKFAPRVASSDEPVWVLFLFSMFGSACVEYITSYVLEKRFHARWWDYSKVPLNINGRICLPASIGFGFAGVIIIKYLIPAASGLHSTLPPLLYEALALPLALGFGADIALTEASLSSLVKTMEEFRKEFDEKAESTYTRISSAKEHARERRAAIASQKESLPALRKPSREALARYAGRISPAQRHIFRQMRTFTPRKGEKDVSPLQRLREYVEENHK